MKKTLLNVLGATVVMAIVASCGTKDSTVQTGDAQDAAAAAGADYTVSTDETTLAWSAEKVGGAHNGVVKLAGGLLNVVGGNIEAGKFDVDLNTIQVEDITDAEQNANLVGHLKSDDFFSVEKFPLSSFEITGVEKGAVADSVTVNGNLTIKGISKNISIPAYVAVDSTSANVVADFAIDRTEWDIKYKSGKFFPELGDKAIKDAIKFKLNLKASKN